MSSGRQLSLCRVCLSPPAVAVSIQQPVAGSGRPLGDVISDLVSAPDRHMLRTVCHQCHQLLADFDAATERARALRSTIQSVFDRADRHLVAMLLEPSQSRAVLAAAARHRQTGVGEDQEQGTEPEAPAVHIEILQAADGNKLTPTLVSAVAPPERPAETAPVPPETAPAVRLVTADAPSGSQTEPGAVPPAGGMTTAAPPTATSVPSSDLTSTPTITTNITISSISSSTANIASNTGDSNTASVSTANTSTAAAACRYRCSLCGEGFRDKSLLLAHRRRRHGSHPRGGGGGGALECSVCRQRFTSRAALRRHERSHSSAGRLDCATCGRTFRRAATLQAHQRLHDERGLCCPYCPQKYTSRQDLEQHVARHTGARNCACPECGKTYRFRSNLAHHVQTVHRKAELACAVCGKTFNMMKKLRRHRNIVHGRLRYKCTECDSRFCYEGQLRRHMKKAKHANAGKDHPLEAYIETVETDVDGTQMLTLVIEDGASGPLGEDDTRETLVLSVGENFDSNLVDASVERGVGCGNGDGTILEIIGDGDLTADSADQIILEG